MADHQLLIIGGGPGGYVAAIRAAQLGMNVGLVEAEEALGGTCVRVGCIPSKALLESTQKYIDAKENLAAHGVNVTGEVQMDIEKLQERRVSVAKQNSDGVGFLMKKNKVTVYHGFGKITKPGTVSVTAGDDEKIVTAEKIVIATGSDVSTLPGVEIDGEIVVSSTEALEFNEAPGSLAVIGAGVIGLELGSVWNRLGSDVTVIEYLDRILPTNDLEIAKEAQKLLRRQGLDFVLGAAVQSVKVTGKGKKRRAVIEIDGKDPIEADRVLVAVGRKPHTEGLGLDEIGVNLDDRGCVVVNANYQTNVAGIYAIGDVIAGPMLAHKASEDGVALVEQLAGQAAAVDYNLIPSVVYTEPEIAAVGQTEEQLKADNVPYRKGSFPFMANGRARAMGTTDGKVKILAHEETDRVLGVHIIGPHAGELIAAATAAITFGASSEDIALTIHAHPTLAEVIKEAALAVDGRPLHI